MESQTLSIPDIVVIVVYLFFVITVGLWAPVIEFIRTRILKKQPSEKPQHETEAYFLANRQVGWIAIGASLFCSNIGSEHFIGLTGSGAVTGITVAYYELSGGLVLLLLGFFFVRVYTKAKIFTTPEYIEKRFSKHIKNYLVFSTLLVYIFTKVSVTIFAACIVFETVLGWNMYFSAVIILAATALYTILGGFRAVIYTEVVQTVVLLFGACCLMILTYIRVGGLAQFMREYPEKFHFIQPITHKQYPWPGLLIGVNLVSIQYWCTDQLLVQRVLCAKDQKQAELGSVFAGYLKLAPMFMLVIPGVMAGVLFPEQIKQDPNKAFTLLVVNIMPPVLKGLLLSAMLSAAMSTLSSVFNSASTIFTMDIYSKWRTQASETELVWVGRLTSSVMIVLSVFWIPVMQRMNDQLFLYIQSVAACTAPPIAAIFLCGILFKRATSPAALITCIVGFLLGAVRFTMEIIFKNSRVDNFVLYVFTEMNFLYYGLLLFSTSMILMLACSLCTKPAPVEQLENYTINWKEFAHDLKYDLMFWKTRPEKELTIVAAAVQEQQQELEEAKEPEHQLSTSTAEEISAPIAEPLVQPAPPKTSIATKIYKVFERLSLPLAIILVLLITIQTIIFF